MLIPEIADMAQTCRVGCGKKIRKGHAVLHLKLSYPVSPMHRDHYFHVSCMQVQVQAAQMLEGAMGLSVWFDETRQKMIESGRFLVEA